MTDRPAYLSRELANGATVSDWLGTSALALRLAAAAIEDLRSGDVIGDAFHYHDILRNIASGRAEFETVLYYMPH